MAKVELGKPPMKTSRVFASALWLIMLIDLLLRESFSVPLAHSDNWNLLVIILGIVTIFGWFIFDSRERGAETSKLLKLAVIGIAIIAVPYYKFRYFGFLAGFKFLGILLAIFVSVGVAAVGIDVIIDGGIDNCTSIRDEVIDMSNEDPYPENRLIKIYDPREISRTDKEIKCEGIGSWGDTTESKILYRVYQDREGDWMIEYYPLGNK